MGEMVFIPSGEFLMGSTGEDVERLLNLFTYRRPSRYANEQPQHVVYLDAFYIDKYEVTNAEYARFLDATGRTPPVFWNDELYNQPRQAVMAVSWEDAAAYARWAGKRLPTEAEWEYAALALIGNTYEERLYERRLYPWDGHYLRNASRKYRGRFMANFVRGKGDYMGLAGDLNDNAAITAPVKSYWPNDYGLYCMAGNVNEWVADVYRQLNSVEVDPLNPYRGNIFKVLERDQDGNVAEKDSLGRLRYREVTPEKVADRYNYQKADYRNYKDGDLGSAISNTDDWKGEDRGTSQMYAQDAENNDFTTLVNDRARVYKGGSWMDRAYWLIPSTRRFLDEKSARADLGFRCAMTRVGSPSGF